MLTHLQDLKWPRSLPVVIILRFACKTLSKRSAKGLHSTNCQVRRINVTKHFLYYQILLESNGCMRHEKVR